MNEKFTLENNKRILSKQVQDLAPSLNTLNIIRMFARVYPSKGSGLLSASEIK